MRSGLGILMLALFVGVLGSSANAAPNIPKGSKPLTNEAIKAALGGKTFEFVVYDSKKSLTGTSTWDLERGIVFGEYSWDGKSPRQWKRKWYVENNKNCTKSRNKQPECQNIYLDGKKFIEVTDDGTIHAVSTPKD